MALHFCEDRPAENVPVPGGSSREYTSATSPNRSTIGAVLIDILWEEGVARELRYVYRTEECTRYQTLAQPVTKNSEEAKSRSFSVSGSTTRKRRIVQLRPKSTFAGAMSEHELRTSRRLHKRHERI